MYLNTQKHATEKEPERSVTSVSRLTGQFLDHEKPSCELPGAVAPVSATTNWWKAKNFSFSFDFFQNQVTLDCDLQAPSQKNDERLAGQVVHPWSILLDGGPPAGNNATCFGSR